MTRPLHPNVRAVICQIQAIAESVAGPASDLDCFELDEVARALARTSEAVESRLDWIDTFGNGGTIQHAVTRSGSGSPSSIFGAIVDILPPSTVRVANAVPPSGTDGGRH
jgi:hypothetical protein